MAFKASEPANRQLLALALMLISAGAVVAGGAFLKIARDNDGVATLPQSMSATSSVKSGDAFVLHEASKPVPALSFIDAEGQEVSLGTFRGKTILLNIWATWCLPCREEMPALERLEKKLGGSDFQVVALSIDRGGLPKVNAFYEEFGLKSLRIYVDPSMKASYALGAVGIPTTLLINPRGLEVGRLVGPAEWDSPELIEIIQRQLEARDVR